MERVYANCGLYFGIIKSKKKNSTSKTSSKTTINQALVYDKNSDYNE